MANVCRQAQAITLVVQTQCEHIQRLVLVLDAGFACALGGVKANAELVTLTKAAPQISRNRALTARVGPYGHARQRLVWRTFRQKVDGAAKAGSTRRSTIQKGIGATEDFGALDKLGRYVLTRQQAVKPVVRDVVGEQREAPNDV